MSDEDDDLSRMEAIDNATDELAVRISQLSRQVVTQELTTRYVERQLVQQQQFIDRAVRLLKRAAEQLIDARDETELLHEIGAFVAQLGVDRVPYEPGTP